MSSRLVRALMRLLRRRGNRPTIDELTGTVAEQSTTIENYPDSRA